MNDPKCPAKVLRQLHGVEATHLRSEPVHEQFQGQTIWQGTVEVYSVRGHPTATHAYAWTYDDDDGKLHHVAVLGLPSVKCAVDAVRVVAVAKSKRR